MSALLLLAALPCLAQADFGPPSAVLGESHARGHDMQTTFPFFHSSEALQAEVHRLAAGCDGRLTTRAVRDEESNTTINVAHVRGGYNGTKPLNRVFILAGEHAREMIGSETVLHLLRVLCGDAPLGGNRSLHETLAESEFEVVLNGNPRSRLDVEAGKFCRRSNPSGIDLNRNWDHRWKKGWFLAPQNSGKRPFSEPESRLARQLMEEFRPTLYLSIHSGTLGLYMPWAYSTRQHSGPNQEAMLRVLKDVDARHCNCPYGGAGREVGYSCPGTSMDYAYAKLGTPYSFAFEIWTSGNEMRGLHRRYDKYVNQNEKQTSLRAFGTRLRSRTASLLQAGTEAGGGSENVASQANAAMDCWAEYNPTTEQQYRDAVSNWAEAYIDTAHLVAEDLRAGGPQSVTVMQ